jgi:hypothetical protein
LFTSIYISQVTETNKKPNNKDIIKGQILENINDINTDYISVGTAATQLQAVALVT